MSDEKLLRMGGGTAVLGGIIWVGFHVWLIQSGQLNMGSLGILILPLLGFMIASYTLSRAGGE